MKLVFFWIEDDFMADKPKKPNIDEARDEFYRVGGDKKVLSPDELAALEELGLL